MRCEVALLNRNILIKGSDESWDELYGGHMMFHGTEEEGLQARISYVELKHMG